MQRDELEQICTYLPVFPLPRAVLLPGSTLPLHVFEPRYRDLVQYCLAEGGPRAMGIATLRPGYEEAYEGSPELYELVGIGEIVAHQSYPDGRSNVALSYVGRARIVEEQQTPHRFRVVRGELLEDQSQDIEPALRSLRVLVMQLGGLSTAASEEARRLVQLEGMDLADALARRLLDDVSSQLAYLGADRLLERIHLVQEHLVRFMAPTQPVGEA